MRIGFVRSGVFDAGTSQVEPKTRVQGVWIAVYGLVHLWWEYITSSQIVQVVSKLHIVIKGEIVIKF